MAEAAAEVSKFFKTSVAGEPWMEKAPPDCWRLPSGNRELEDHELAKAATQISELCQPALPASLLRGTPTAHGGALAIPRHGCQQRSGVIKIPWLTVGPSTLHPKS